MIYRSVIIVCLSITLAIGQISVLSGSSQVAGQSANAQLTLTLVPKLTLALTCNQGAIAPAQTLSCTATINIAAPVGGAVVNLSVDQPTKVQIPASVTIPSGAMSAPFSVTGL